MKTKRNAFERIHARARPLLSEPSETLKGSSFGHFQTLDPLSRQGQGEKVLTDVGGERPSLGDCVLKFMRTGMCPVLPTPEPSQ